MVEDPSQVIRGCLGLSEASRELGQDEPAKIAGDAWLPLDGPVELRDGVVHPGDPPEQGDVTGQAGLEEPLEGEE